jgi:uncharacterized protein YrzB (UPF0473 family)
MNKNKEYRRSLMENNNDYNDEEMTVELELDDGTLVNCAVITILTVESKDYIALLPLKDGQSTQAALESEESEVWFYRYSENPEDPDEEPQMDYIEDDDEYEKVADAFDEYLDTCEFEELADD